MLPTITFVALTYNHEAYVLQHLESIAYLIRRYAQPKVHDLVISDDCSIDSTKRLVSRWIQANSKIFRNVTLYTSVENVGTCKSFLRATKNVNTDYIKITGGDDLYSDGDIFSMLINPDQLDIIGTMPLVLINDIVYRFHRHNIIHAVANAVYANKPFRKQLTGHGAIFTPGLIYASKLIADERIRAFIDGFDLVEDLPTWIAIAEFYPTVNYRVLHTNIVYYRRTPGSAYLIAGSRTFNDHLKCREYLYHSETKLWNKLIINNRLNSMKKNKFSKRFTFDFGKLIFCAELMLVLYNALMNIVDLRVSLHQHDMHLKLIKSKIDENSNLVWNPS